MHLTICLPAFIGGDKSAAMLPGAARLLMVGIVDYAVVFMGCHNTDNTRVPEGDCILFIKPFEVYHLSVGPHAPHFMSPGFYRRRQIGSHAL